MYKYATQDFEHYNASRFPDSPVCSAYVDKHGEVWFEQHISGSVVHFNPLTRILKTETVAVEPTSTDRSRPAFHVHEDVHGSVWVHPYGGGFPILTGNRIAFVPFIIVWPRVTGVFPIKSMRLSRTSKAICGCAPIPKDWKK